MTAIADDVAVPAFELIGERVDAVSSAAESICADSEGQPDEASVSAVQDAVAAARAAWNASEAVWVGPEMDRHSDAVVDWEIDTEAIAELLAEGNRAHLRADYLGRSVGAGSRGLAAVSWVLGDGADAAPLDVRCAYVDGAVEVVGNEVDLILGDWTDAYDEGPPYRAVFAGNVDGGDVEAQLDMTVNNIIFMLESMSTSDDAAPPADQVARIQGIRTVLAGDGADVDGLRPLLGDELADRLASELGAAIDTYETGDVDAGSTAAQDAHKTVRTEVVSRLGVTVGFSDTDGDGGS